MILLPNADFGGGAGDDDTGRGRDQQRRNLRDEAVTDVSSVKRCSASSEVMPFCTMPMTKPPMMLTPTMMSRRDRVAADELARTVHRAVEVGLPLDVLAALARLGLGDHAGVEVGVDRPSACRAWRPR